VVKPLTILRFIFFALLRCPTELFAQNLACPLDTFEPVTWLESEQDSTSENIG
jgi:hypothetical protein